MVALGVFSLESVGCFAEVDLVAVLRVERKKERKEKFTTTTTESGKSAKAM